MVGHARARTLTWYVHDRVVHSPQLTATAVRRLFGVTANSPSYQFPRVNHMTPFSCQVHEDLDNEGVLMHAVDTLPAELPIEATTVTPAPAYPCPGLVGATALLTPLSHYSHMPYPTALWRLIVAIVAGAGAI